MSKNSARIVQGPVEEKHRTIIYIDGQNFLHRCAEKLIKSGAISDQEELVNINVKQIFKKLFPKDNFEIRYYGVNKIRERRDLGLALYSKSKKFADNLRRIRSNFTRQGIVLKDVGQLKVRSTDVCKRCGFVDYKYQEKGVDVGLATDMVRDALLGHTDKVVLVSSDIDMLPAIKIVREAGIELVYVCFDGSANHAIINNSSSVLRIHNLGILEAFEATFNPKML